MANFKFISLFFCLVAAFHVNASGGYRSGSYSESKAETDPVYEKGKAIVKGRSSSYQDFSFCVAPDSGEAGAESIKNSTMKFLRKSSAKIVADNLIHCENPEVSASSVLEGNDLDAVIHYLDKRYKLNLES